MPAARSWLKSFAHPLAVVSIAFSAVVYAPLLNNYFHGDDFPNLFQIRNGSPLEYLFTPHGGHVLVTRNAAFYLCAKVFGTNAEGFFWVVLLTHLLNVWLLFMVIRVLTGSERLACFGATLFGTCPAAEGSLGWYSVYGQVLVVTAYLPILHQVARGAAEDRFPSRAQRLFWYVLSLAAMSSFGVGVGLALALPFVIGVLAPTWRRRWRLPPLASLVVVVPVLYIALLSAYGWLGHGKRVAAASLLSQVIDNWSNVFSMLFHLVAYAAMRLAVGFFPSPAYPSTAGYAVMGLLATAAALVVLMAPGRPRRLVLACVLMAVSCYGMIAMGRIFFFTALGEVGIGYIVGQPRYHYAGLVPLVLLLCVLLAWLGRSKMVRTWLANALLAIWMITSAVAYQQFGLRIDHHREARRDTLRAVNWMKASIRGHSDDEPVYFFNRPLAAVSPLWIPMTSFPGWAGVFTLFFDDNTVDGHRVYFIERNPRTIEALRDGRRTAGLFVTPPEVPGPLGEALRAAMKRHAVESPSDDDRADPRETAPSPEN